MPGYKVTLGGNSEATKVQTIGLGSITAKICLGPIPWAPATLDRYPRSPRIQASQATLLAVQSMYAHDVKGGLNGHSDMSEPLTTAGVRRLPVNSLRPYLMCTTQRICIIQPHNTATSPTERFCIQCFERRTTLSPCSQTTWNVKVRETARSST